MILKDERIGGQRLILGDCLAVMPLLGKVDAVVTDPPFGIGYSNATFGGKGYGHRYEQKDWDAAAPDLTEIVALSVPTMIWGGNYFPLPPSRGWLSWFKPDALRSFSDMELCWTSLSMPAKTFTYSARAVGYERLDAGFGHATQKPLPLMTWCLGFLPTAKTILDPFMGSGTTLVACQKLGRAGIGIEIDPDYFEIACRRVDEAARQPDFFTQPAAKPVQEGLPL
jgi:DNA modification methylase